ncbi:tripartite motif-containing protein 2-like [Haliotis cracherodii]|uniref:tripartite motif-containing protein 2-like n=1 Tax=Haliotis cracherodii TaxID=6455 RepID=UPI0039E7A784
MAVMMDPTDDVSVELECSICLEVYRDPKTLPCIHSFCRVCIIRHVVCQAQICKREKRFHCPLCRNPVYIPRPDAPVEKWADQLPNNTQIPDLIASLMCKHHPKMIASYYCKKCKCVTCDVCRKERHPLCEDDSFCPLKDIASKKKSDMTGRQQKIDVKYKHMSDNVDLIKSVASELPGAEALLVKRIEDQARSHVQSVLNAKRDLLSMLEASVDQQLALLKHAKNPVDEAADVLNHYKSEVDHVMKTSTGLDYVESVDLVKARHREGLEMIQNLHSKCRPPIITFVENESVSTSIGELVSPVLCSSPFLANDVFLATPPSSQFQWSDLHVSTYESIPRSSPPNGQNPQTPVQPSSPKGKQPSSSSQKLSPMKSYLKAMAKRGSRAFRRSSSDSTP